VLQVKVHIVIKPHITYVHHCCARQSIVQLEFSFVTVTFCISCPVIRCACSVMMTMITMMFVDCTGYVVI